MIFGIRESKDVSHAGESLLDLTFVDSLNKRAEFWAELDEKWKVTINEESFNLLIQNEFNAKFDFEMNAVFST